MRVDWFTIAAQAANFLILVALLRKFLYERILAAITRRQEEIRAQVDAAHTEREMVAAQRQALEAEQATLQAKREEMLAEIAEETKQERERLFRLAEEDAAAAKARYYQAFEDEKEAASQALRAQVRDTVTQIAERALHDLAGSTLSEQMVRRFLGDLELRGQWLAAAQHESPGEGAVVRTAVGLRDDLAAQVRDVLARGGAAGMEVKFEVAPSLGAGIELRIGGNELAWSLDKYLSDFDVHLGIAS